MNDTASTHYLKRHDIEARLKRAREGHKRREAREQWRKDLHHYRQVKPHFTRQINSLEHMLLSAPPQARSIVQWRLSKLDRQLDELHKRAFSLEERE